jgi:hypothetical protein
MSYDLADQAREYLADVRRTSVEQLPPSVLARECAELRRLLGLILGILAERQVLRPAQERASRLAAAMTADLVATAPGDGEWTVQDVISVAIDRGLRVMEGTYLTGGEQ